LKDEYSDDEVEGDDAIMEADEEDMEDEFGEDNDEEGMLGELLEDDMMDGDDEDDDDDEEEEEQMSNRQRKKLQQRGGIKLKTGSTFASADEFADLLLNNDSNNKQTAWEEGNWRKKSNFSGNKRKFSGKGSGGRKGNKRQRRG